MKKIIIALLSVLFVLTLTGCKEEGPKVPEVVEKSISEMNNNFYMLTISYDIKDNEDLNYDEYYCGKMHSDDKLNFGFITCLSYLQQADGSFKLAIDEKDYESDYDYDDYFKTVSSSETDLDVTYKYSLGYGPLKDLADKDESYWNEIVLHFDKYESDGIIYGSFEDQGTYEEQEVEFTETITFTKFNSLQEAFDMCKQLDTRNEYAD